MFCVSVYIEYVCVFMCTQVYLYVDIMKQIKWDLQHMLNGINTQYIYKHMHIYFFKSSNKFIHLYSYLVMFGASKHVSHYNVMPFYLLVSLI